MTQQSEALWELHLILSNNAIPYAIIGGIAVQHWGEPRLTQDIDLTILVPLDDPLPTLQIILGAFEARLQDALTFALKSRVLLIQASNGYPIDLSLGLPGYEESVVERTVNLDIDSDKWVKLCSAEDLIIHKAVAGRPQDLHDIEGVVLRQGTRLDVSYIRSWLTEFADLLGDLEILVRFEQPWQRATGG